MHYKYVAHNSLLPFYLAWQIKPDSANYNLCFSYELDSESHVGLLIEKLQSLILQQAHLRQTFNLELDQLIATIHEDLPAKISFLTSTKADWSTLEESLIKEVHNISAESSIKLNIINFSNSNGCIALFNIHHILLDGHSVEQLIINLNRLMADEGVQEEEASAYAARIAKEIPLQTETSLKGTYIKQANKIANEIDYPITPSSSEVLYYTAILPDEVQQSLIQLSEQYSLSAFNLLLLTWGIFMTKIVNHSHELISYPANIRTDKSIEGCFVNTLTFPLSLKKEDTYLSLIHECKNKLLLLKALVRTSISGALNITPLSSFSNSNVAQLGELIVDKKVYTATNYAQIANACLSIKYRNYKGKCFFSCTMVKDLFPNYFSSSLLLRFFNFLNKLLANRILPLAGLDATFLEERHLVLYDFNNAASPYPKDKTICELFEEQVRKTPSSIAIVYNETTLTYDQLNKKSNQLAHYLKKYNLKANDLIALLLSRNENMIISILGVLKSGIPYVPLEPNYPIERIKFILEDTKANIILTNETHQPKLEFFKKNSDLVSNGNKYVIAIDSQAIKINLAKQAETNLDKKTSSTELMYVIYTSGTTGTPKGVMVKHKGVINTLYALDKVYKTTNNHPLKITAFTSYVFDVSVSEFFAALLRGHELHILNNTLRKDAALIGEYINNKLINYVYLPPVLLAILPRIEYPSLQGIIYAGEPCDKETGIYWSNKYKLYNYYGPTEASIYATGLEINSGQVHLIGKPIPNTAAYVLNFNLNPLPIGIVGELYLGGVGLAKGYLNQEGLTTEKFITNPFRNEAQKITKENEHLYKTGDLVRWLPDGNIEYIGRNDFQVKIKGYRIELGEIENKLLSYPTIKQAIAVVKEHIGDKNTKYIVAYYVANTTINSSVLYDFLAAQLPEYMLPSALIYLNKLPITTSGKLDRNALPAPEFTNIYYYQAPANEIETMVCDLFAEILRLDKVGVNDDFFRLGGDSIKAIMLSSRLQIDFNINVADIFNSKTPKKIAKNISFVKNNFKQRLAKIAMMYQAKKPHRGPSEELQNKINDYLSSVKNLPKLYPNKGIANVLLTGATGFLGCNLLHQLLMTTDYNIFLLVRANSQVAAFDRINKKFQFYFDEKLDSFYAHRLFVFPSDIEKNDLGLSTTDYHMLATQIDSIIHSAALTKHYGEYTNFYSANVQATIRMLEFSKLTRLKDFHYISTISVLTESYISDCEYPIFTEDDSVDMLERCNVYVRTKYEGEKEVIKYRQHGVSSNIYRVGNLAFISRNCRAQQNIEDNAFFNRIRCLVKLGVMPREMSMEEISPADLTAQAIVKLFDKASICNKTHHVLNPHLYDMANILVNKNYFDVRVVPVDKFIYTISERIDDLFYRKLIERFLLHQGWLDEWCLKKATVKVLMEKTKCTLKLLNFEWCSITDKIFEAYIKREMELSDAKKNENT